MSVPKVYLDTSVIGGCCDDEFRQFNAVNALVGRKKIEIYTPMEVASEEV